ncbi:imidazole glycerol phosphate synthase subunit HisH [Lactococcus protaetiae]|uniref:Imidazole glycerol phosphate synthase subunit HisH n=1 Tax=Lactococcus protaetiae TaxID=2592653 RepID=A0A514Z976_9LACT|nr:imidazole glycerol phosphate synthase subunit HisH [Lactococcus protaetiae]QDK71139.1 imidazole glycerol phosphate synthase subunit HisH [Lactococcus protaetiae]
MIVIIDYNVGNLQSVQGAIERLGMECIISRDSEQINKAQALILPGVGAFPTAMKQLTQYNLVELIKTRAAAGVPILGICLGMQILFEKGTEKEKTNGLGLLKGSVNLIQTTQKLPHMGWNQLHFTQNHPLLRYLKENDETYFVHSYAVKCPKDELIAYTEYGDVKIPAIVASGNVMGCQFHPEKSAQIGQLILKAFKEMILC